MPRRAVGRGGGGGSMGAVVARAAAATGAGCHVGWRRSLGWRLDHGCCWGRGHASSSVGSERTHGGAIRNPRTLIPIRMPIPTRPMQNRPPRFPISRLRSPRSQRESLFRPGSMFVRRRRESAVAVGLGPPAPRPRLPPTAVSFSVRQLSFDPEPPVSFRVCAVPSSLLLSQSGAR